MKPLFQWVRNHVALSFFFAIEIIGLFYGIVFVIGTYGEDNRNMASISSPPILLITEEPYRDLVTLELKEFAHFPTSRTKVLVATREQAIQAFENNENAILILSKPLEEEEILAFKMKPERLPVHQDVIDYSEVSDAGAPVFITDNVASKIEHRLAIFLRDNEVQDVVFQKFNQRPQKSPFKKG
ncbi:type 2 periplasmic-binding domain-containing protein [Flavilitoribacter nigricans]|uniref:Uncharacterized protein n=1 Tax=Flavilitoribacter nigricans (strain ATCC 23147 / DSM 23189 / NBRC 102662 / NCIMB 1420 / SS-2) TaxID=1122177 RepID=A0A2D0N116_FLAN2|nr:hypothetical protein [Flavilitoribacter nigricans]PHN02185.1 hypothetical protein CRP01_33150 [Flavilitoribacter nigricans DSM 23189 = NBRC 102662]